MEIRLVGNEVHVSRHSSKDIEGPVFRVPGNVEQAVLPGLEHLGRGERSSTDLDIHGPERIRHTPELTSLTWPFMSMLTDRASVSIQWDSSQKPQPVFAAPDFFEGTHSQRLALKGRKLEARVRIAGPWSKEERLETTLRWGVRSMGGLPETPKAPRTADAQLEFCASALESGILRGENGGWYHALVPGDRTSPERPVPFADHLSILHRLTGRIEDSPSIVPGGSHLDDPSIWFLRNRAEDWLRSIEGRANKARKRMRTDGSFGYGGAFRQGHFEDTASGHCARPVVDLLLAARWTGNQDFLSAGIKGLENLKRFRTPRGAQVWECPLHAPDILAAALLVQANVLGHELTGNPAYLEEARRWAWSGLPYVYLWDDGREIMRYATIATLCATKYQAPVWIGRPVQWCGIVYADAILDLDRHDPTMDWRKVALGILVSGEQQQYTNGPSRGLLADSTILSDQSLHPYDITPCAIAQLRLKIMERPQGIYSSEKGGHRLISPYPIRSFDGGNWELDAPEGLKFQVLLDGQPFEAR